MTNAPTRQAPGLTVIEVLAAISIAALLTAFLLPAVQKVRAVASRLSCQSNMRQLAIATQNYESTFGYLPAAFRHRGPATDAPHLQWPVRIAPYLEYDAVAREADQDFSASKDAIVPTPHRGLSVVMKPFGCPSDTRTAQAWDVTFYYSLTVPNQTLVTVKVGLNSYIGNGGELSKLRDGTIIADGRLAVGHISDGTSNTILYGERPPSSDLLFGWHYVGWGVRARGMGELTSVIGVKDPNPFGDLHYDLNCGPGPFPYREPDLTAETDCAFFQYWSLHDGGANFAFADGSVRFLRYAANDILPALATRAGGEVVPAVD